MLTYSGLDNILIRLGIALCSPSMAQTMISEINAKSDSSAMAAALALKADAAATATALSGKVSGSAGLWAARPVAGLVDGLQFFATDEAKPYWYSASGVGTKWFDAAGVEHV